MKVGGKSDTPSALQDAVRVNLNKSSADAKALKAKTEALQISSLVDGLSSGNEGDKVNLGLGRAINAEFDPIQFVADRRKRVDELKAKVQNKQYEMPSSEKLAKAVAEEIALQVVENRGRVSNE